jgi:chromosome segregation ATPase
MPIDEQNLDTIETAEQADALLESIEAPSHEPVGEATPAPQAIEEFDLTVGGKQIKAKREQLIQWAQQGYTAPNRISQLTKDLEGWKQKYSELEPKYKTYESQYKPIDEYVKQKPEFWDHVLKQWEQRENLLNDTANPGNQVLTELQKQVQDLMQYKQSIENERMNTQIKQEDSQYHSVLEETKKQYADIDFDAPDEDGKSLEYKILEHAQKEGIKNFKTAFRDFYHDELTKRAAAKAKEDLTKNKVKNTKLGILGISPTPTKRTQSDHRGKSYDDIAQEIKDEYGF